MTIPVTLAEIKSDIELLLAMVGIGLAILFYFKGRRLKQPMYSIRSAHLIQNMIGPGGLEIYYGGQLITNLMVSKILFWNSGQDIIDKKDIASPLAVIIRNGKILNAELLKRSTEL